jgi:hypothetical protein
MPFRISGNRGSQRAGRVQSMSIGRSAAFAQTVTRLLLDAKDVASGRRDAPSGSPCEGTWSISASFNPKKNGAL